MAVNLSVKEQEQFIMSLADMFQDIDVSTVKDVLTRNKFNISDATDDLLNISDAQTKSREEEKKKKAQEEEELKLIQKQIHQQQQQHQSGIDSHPSSVPPPFVTSNHHNNNNNNSNIGYPDIFRPQPQVPTAPPAASAPSVFDDPVAKHYSTYNNNNSHSTPTPTVPVPKPAPTQFDNYYQRISQLQQQQQQHQHQQQQQQPQSPYSNFSAPHQQYQSSPYSDPFTVIPNQSSSPPQQQQQQPSPYHRPQISTLSPTVSKSPAGYIHNFPPLTPISSTQQQSTSVIYPNVPTQSPLNEDEFTSLSSTSSSSGFGNRPVDAAFYTPLEKANKSNPPSLSNSASGIVNNQQQQQQSQSHLVEENAQQASEIESLKKELESFKASQESLLEEVAEMRKELLSTFNAKEEAQVSLEKSEAKYQQLDEEYAAAREEHRTREYQFGIRLGREKTKYSELQQKFFSSIELATKDFRNFIDQQEDEDSMLEDENSL